ncbi:histidine kinase dimerization/phospho-acceptor domain-containing protein [Trueperella pyogenes]|uniref:histidine kinase dimerization/phospho-acceptor domain-containing protein n=1 Tax=Trueperella pyogenes TaxID=1661 RepID=UPI0023DE115D|nr:histidine kinase dimerization/phospho-acceptor domain-containing protein [Trueperella pyogenes]
MITIITAIVAAGTILGLIAYNRSITAQLAAARAEVKRYESQPAVVAHEIRTPLSLIEAAAELLVGQSPGPLNETQVGFVNTIFDNALQAIGIAENSLVQRRLKDETSCCDLTWSTSAISSPTPPSHFAGPPPSRSVWTYGAEYCRSMRTSSSFDSWCGTSSTTLSATPKAKMACACASRRQRTGEHSSR